MKVEILDHLQPKVLKASRVLVRNSFGDPVAVIVEYRKDVFMISRIFDPDFHVVLDNLGIEDTTIVEVLMPKTIDQYNFPQPR